MKLYFNTGYVLIERFYRKSVHTPTSKLDSIYRDIMRITNTKDYSKFLGMKISTRAKIVALPTDPVIIKSKKIS